MGFSRGINLWAALSGLMVLAILGGCDSQTDKREQVNADPAQSELQLPAKIHPAQNWSPDISEQLHHLSFGSQLIPYQWAGALLTKDGNHRFFSTENLSTFGLIAGKDDPSQWEKAAIGLTKSEKHDKTWLGLGCAACHTGEITYQGHSVILDGGQGLFNFQLFEQSLYQALWQTIRDDNRLVEFANAIGESDLATVKNALQERVDYLGSRQDINRTEVAYGYGRLDAFGQIFNTVAVELLNIPENRRSPDAPVSYPVLWSASHLDLVQWNGSAPNAGPGPLLQNVTTAIAVYGKAKVVESDAALGYESSVNIDNLKTIQKHLYELQSPQWPQELLGKLDPKLVRAGKKIYHANCVTCHQLVDRNNPKQELKVALTPLTDVGTDPTMVFNFMDAKANAGSLTGKKILFLAGDVIQSKEATINLVARVAVGAALHHPLQTLDATIEDYQKVYKAAVPKMPDYYKGRPLNGIWASAPYLHNGSVLTLQELLSPVLERRRVFYVGNKEFDVNNVGLLSGDAKSLSINQKENMLFDTSLPGNSNAGHLYGTTLDKSKKRALLEYLKSL